MYLYDKDMNNRYTIDHESIHLANKSRYALIGNPDKNYGTLNDHEYFPTNDDFFDRILSTNNNDNISLNIIPKNMSSPIINKFSNNLSNKSSTLREGPRIPNG